MISEKIYPTDWFRRKIILGRKYLGEKIPTLKKKSFVAYNSGNKSYTCKCQKKNSYPNQIIHTNSVGRKMTPFPETVSDKKKKNVFRRRTVKFEAI